MPPSLADRAAALEKTFDATDTACAHDDCLLRVGREYDEVGRDHEGRCAVNWHLAHVEYSWVVDFVDLYKSTEALLEWILISHT